MTVTTVDAFARRPFTGNPAAVCVLDGPAPADWMQALASEMNLSETAFLVPGVGLGDDETWGLRWFTPEVEIDLCGHATLASAHVLYESGRLAEGEPAQFDTRSGRLTVRHRASDGASQRGDAYVMDFPATPPEPAEALAGLAEALGVSPVWTGRTRFDVFAVLESEAAVRSLAPDHSALARLDARGVIVTAQADRRSFGTANGDRQSDADRFDRHAKGDRQPDVVSRFFAPGSGVPEDPVTGSAHCAIGPYWASVLGTNAVACYQASARGGHVGVTVRGDRVDLTGHAVTVYRATLAPAAQPPVPRG